MQSACVLNGQWRPPLRAVQVASARARENREQVGRRRVRTTYSRRIRRRRRILVVSYCSLFAVPCSSGCRCVGVSANRQGKPRRLDGRRQAVLRLAVFLGSAQVPRRPSAALDPIQTRLRGTSLPAAHLGASGLSAQLLLTARYSTLAPRTSSSASFSSFSINPPHPSPVQLLESIPAGLLRYFFAAMV